MLRKRPLAVHLEVRRSVAEARCVSKNYSRTRQVGCESLEASDTDLCPLRGSL
jgi:hypothetical protein